MKGIFLFFIAGLGGFSTCPCVKTARIGIDANAAVIHNNVVIAMNDTEIVLGAQIELRTKECSGVQSWYLDGTPIGSSRVSPTETSVYTVKSSLKNCPDVFDHVTITVLDDVGETNLDSVLIYPNPTSDLLTLSSKEKSIQSAFVYNTVGRLLFSVSFSSEVHHQQINLSELSSGIYIVKIALEGDWVVVRKIIKN